MDTNKCPYCKRRVSLYGDGTYECPYCKSYFKVKKGGIKPFKELKNYSKKTLGKTLTRKSDTILIYVSTISVILFIIAFIIFGLFILDEEAAEMQRILKNACGCNNVSVEEVARAVRNGADTVEKVTAATGAGANCDKCKGGVLQSIIKNRG